MSTKTKLRHAAFEAELEQIRCEWTTFYRRRDRVVAIGGLVALAAIAWAIVAARQGALWQTAAGWSIATAALCITELRCKALWQSVTERHQKWIRQGRRKQAKGQA